MSSPRANPMIRAAARRPALWRLALGLLTVFGGLLLWIAVLILVRAFLQGRPFVDTGIEVFALGAPSPQQTINVLLLVAGLGFGTILAAAIWHRRRPGSLVGHPANALRHFVLAALVTLATLAVVSVAVLPFSEPPRAALPLMTWLAWLAPALVAIALQTGGEELLFRGYLQSQLAARFRSRAVSVLVPSLAFGAAHFAPGLPPLAAASYALVAVVFGLLASDLTERTGNLGAAWGFHFANNSLAVLVVAPDGPLSGLALWTSGDVDLVATLTSPLISVEIAVLIVLWFLIRRALGV